MARCYVYPKIFLTEQTIVNTNRNLYLSQVTSIDPCCDLWRPLACGDSLADLSHPTPSPPTHPPPLIVHAAINSEYIKRN